MIKNYIVVRKDSNVFVGPYNTLGEAKGMANQLANDNMPSQYVVYQSVSLFKSGPVQEEVAQ